MMTSGVVRPLCLFLAILSASPCGFAQTPVPVPPVAPPGVPANDGPKPGPMVGAPLKITALEGNNATNSIPLIRSVAPIVEVRDENDFPVEGASVIFTLPDGGPGGTFATGGSTFSTRTDSHGQAAAPLLIPKVPGKFQIRVVATSGIRRAEYSLLQTNSMLSVEQITAPKKPFYKKKLVWIIAGVAVAGIITAIVLTSGGSSGSTVVITPGTPVFR